MCFTTLVCYAACVSYATATTLGHDAPHTHFHPALLAVLCSTAQLRLALLLLQSTPYGAMLSALHGEAVESTLDHATSWPW